MKTGKDLIANTQTVKVTDIAKCGAALYENGDAFSNHKVKLGVQKL